MDVGGRVTARSGEWSAMRAGKLWDQLMDTKARIQTLKGEMNANPCVCGDRTWLRIGAQYMRGCKRLKKADDIQFLQHRFEVAV
jgi:hypothetical protein